MRAIIEHYYKVRMNCVNVDSDRKDGREKPKPLGPFASSSKEGGDAAEASQSPGQCENCGASSILHAINSELQCISCKKFFE